MELDPLYKMKYRGVKCPRDALQGNSKRLLAPTGRYRRFPCSNLSAQSPAKVRGRRAGEADAGRAGHVGNAPKTS